MAKGTMSAVGYKNRFNPMDDAFDLSDIPYDDVGLACNALLDMETIIKIDEMEAGPELDALVAEHVMKLDVVGFMPCMNHGHGYYDVPYDGNAGDFSVVRPICVTNCFCELKDPRDITILGHIAGCLDAIGDYSTDIAAAWKVVEKLHGEISFEICNYLADDTNDVWGWHCQIIYGNSFGNGNGETAPLAICRAALKCVAPQEL